MHVHKTIISVFQLKSVYPYGRHNFHLKPRQQVVGGDPIKGVCSHPQPHPTHGDLGVRSWVICRIEGFMCEVACIIYA